MLGAILGDIAGSRFEFSNNRTKPKELFEDNCFPTDDTWLIQAICYSLYNYKKDHLTSYDKLKNDVLKQTILAVLNHKDAGWGIKFIGWIKNIIYENNINIKNIDNYQNIKYVPNNSAGNGCAMKIASIPYFVDSIEECKKITHEIVSITHNHPDSYKASECLTTSMYMALHNKTKDQIRHNILSYYPEVANMTYTQLNKEYHYTEIAKDTVPQAMVCFLESKDFKDALNMAISIGGDADTLGAITGALAEAFYGWKSLKEEIFPLINFDDYPDPKYKIDPLPLKVFLDYVIIKFPKKFPL